MNEQEFCKAVTEKTNISCEKYEDRQNIYILRSNGFNVPFIYDGGDVDIAFKRIISPAVDSLKSAAIR